MSVSVTFRYAEALNLDGIPNDATVELENGTTIRDVLKRSTASAECRQYATPLVNGVRRSQDYALNNGDECDFVLAVCGG